MHLILNQEKQAFESWRPKTTKFITIIMQKLANKESLSCKSLCTRWDVFIGKHVHSKLAKIVPKMNSRFSYNSRNSGTVLFFLDDLRKFADLSLSSLSCMFQDEDFYIIFNDMLGLVKSFEKHILNI